MEDGTQLLVLKMEENKIELVELLLPESAADTAEEEETAASEIG